MYNAFTVASKQIGNELDSSPDINSSITTISSGDGFPETGTFDSGPVFSQGDHSYLEAFKDIFQQQHFDQSMFICISTQNSQFFKRLFYTLVEVIAAHSITLCNSVIVSHLLEFINIE